MNDMELPESIKSKGDYTKKQDLLIYNKEYHLWREGEYLGVAKYVDDINIGDSFIKESKTSEGEDCFEVYCANEWQFA